MPGNEVKAHGLISACTHNGAGVSVVKNIQSSSNYIKMMVKGQGKRAAGVKAIVGFDRSVTLSMVGRSNVAAETKGTLVTPVIRPDGTIDTHTWLLMKAFEDQYSASDGDGNHDVVTQMFEYEGDGDTDNYTFSPGG